MISNPPSGGGVGPEDLDEIEAAYQRSVAKATREARSQQEEEQLLEAIPFT